MDTINQIGVGLSGASGSGSFAGTTSPVFVTPALGTPSSGVLSSCTGYAQSSLTGLGTGVSTALGVNVGSAGALIVNGGALGTPSSGTLSSCTGLPVSTGISGLGTGIATWLATPSSANLLSAMTTKTGTGSLVFGTSPALTTPSVAQINDANGNPGIALTSLGSANYWAFSNAGALGPISVTATGSDTNIDVAHNTKGTGQFKIAAWNLTQPIVINSGTSGQKVTTFNFSNTSGTNNVTFPDSSGTLLYTGQSVATIKTFIYTSNATYTPTSGTRFVLIEMCGSGGGGGGCQNSTVGTSGGAGGYIKQLLTAAEVGASLSLVVPAGGAAGGTNAAGTAGTATTVSTPSNVIVLTANGGSGGAAGSATSNAVNSGVAGGTASVSTGSVTYTGIYLKGGGSGPAFIIPTIDQCVTSPSGVNPLSTISRAVAGGGLSGESSNGYGGGGTGAISNASGGNRSGGAGSSGVVFITEFS